MKSQARHLRITINRLLDEGIGRNFLRNHKILESDQHRSEEPKDLHQLPFFAPHTPGEEDIAKKGGIVGFFSLVKSHCGLR